MSSIQIYAGFRIRTYGNLPSANMGEYRKERRKGPGLLCPGPLIGSRSVTIPELVSAALQVERDAVHAPPLPTSLSRSVVEEVAEVRAAACAAHLGADHAVRAVLDQFDGVRCDRLGEARPPGARVVFRAAVEDLVAAGGAVVEAVIVGVHVLARERELGGRLAQNGVLLRREHLPPFPVGAGPLIVRRVRVDPDRAAHAGPSQTAVPVRHFVQVLLVVALRIVELPGGCDLRGYRAVTATLKRLLVGLAGLLGGPALLVVNVVDRRAILRADVVALAHPLRRVVGLPEHCEQFPVRVLF